jgi:hypothetical protein
MLTFLPSRRIAEPSSPSLTGQCALILFCCQIIELAADVKDPPSTLFPKCLFLLQPILPTPICPPSAVKFDALHSGLPDFDAGIAAFQDREKQVRKPTPPNVLGPFYKRLTPVNNMLRAPGDPGIPLTLSGQVFNTRGDVVPDHHGHYDLDGYRYRGRLNVNKSGSI